MDDSALDALLLTYPHYGDAETLLKALLTHFASAPRRHLHRDDNVNDNEAIDDHSTLSASLKRDLIFQHHKQWLAQVLQRWMWAYPLDFSSQLFEEIDATVNELPSSEWAERLDAGVLGQLQVLIDDLRTSVSEAKVKQDEARTCEVPRQLAAQSFEVGMLLSTSPRTVAELVTIMQYEKFAVIPPRELVSVQWFCRGDLDAQWRDAPHLLRFVELHNQLVECVENVIGVAGVKAAKFCARLARECLAIGNLDATFAVVGAIQAASEENDALDCLGEEVSEVVLLDDGFRNYRQRVGALVQARKPHLLYMAVVMGDVALEYPLAEPIRSPRIHRSGSICFPAFQRIHSLVQEVRFSQSSLRESFGSVSEPEPRLLELLRADIGATVPRQTGDLFLSTQDVWLVPCPLIEEGTVEGIVCYLLRQVDDDFRSVFFLFYEVFTTPAELLERLLVEMELSPADVFAHLRVAASEVVESEAAPDGGSSVPMNRMQRFGSAADTLEESAPCEDWDAASTHLPPPAAQLFVGRKVHVAQLLLYWLHTYPNDFAPPLRESLGPRLALLPSSAWEQWLPDNAMSAIHAEVHAVRLAVNDVLQHHAEKARKLSTVRRESAQPLPPKVRDTLTTAGPSLVASSCSPGDLARQLTLLHAEVFCAVELRELTDARWTRRERKWELAPSVMAYIAHHNRITYWVVSEIVALTDDDRRAHALSHFLLTAEELLALGNYDLAIALYAAFSTPAVYRLKFTWQRVSRAAAAAYKTLDALGSSRRNHDAYRRAYADLASQHAPRMPFFPLILTDLLRLDTSLETFVQEDVVAFSKFTLYAQQLWEVRAAQISTQQFGISADPELQVAVRECVMKSSPDASDADLYHVSVDAEPSDRADEHFEEVVDAFESAGLL